MSSLPKDGNDHRHYVRLKNVVSEGIPRRETSKLVRYGDGFVSGRLCQAEGWSSYVLAQVDESRKGLRLSTRSRSPDAQLEISFAVLFHYLLNELANGVVQAIVITALFTGS